MLIDNNNLLTILIILHTVDCVFLHQINKKYFIIYKLVHGN